MQLRVNLLPPEVLERRRLEKWYQYIFFGFFALLVLALLIAAWLWILSESKQEELQGLYDQSAQYKKQAAAYSVFEKKQDELAEREQVVNKALAGRVNMGRLADDISLILPDEVWLAQLMVGQDTGLSLDGFTPLSTSHATNRGYKSVAKTLVRLDSLGDLEDVWLTAASSTTFGDWQVDDDSDVPTTTVDVVRFQVSGKVKHDTAEPADSPNDSTASAGATD